MANSVTQLTESLQQAQGQNLEASWNSGQLSTQGQINEQHCAHIKESRKLGTLETCTKNTAKARTTDASMSPLMGMRRIASRDRLKMLSPGSLFNTDAAVSPASDVFHSMDKIKRVSSSSSISHSSLPSLSYGSIYMKLWHGLTTLDLDPHHGIRHMSRIITSHVRDQSSKEQVHNFIPLVTTYHLGLHKLNTLLKTGFPIMQFSTTTQNIFQV
uniref:Uncharacterized protein n=1 Tax=Timema monikensis TaxID=170555 RepID=A0A7R9EAT4_9NEOP|nr:unnamed protein product [Timema monikensis]